MKKLKLFLATIPLFISIVHAQIRISDLPENVGDPTGGFMFLYMNGANQKIDAGKLGYNNLDSAAISGNTISFYKHKTFAFSALLPSAGGSGTVTSVNNTPPVNGNITLAIPTNNSQLANGANYITATALTPYLTTSAASATFQAKGNYLTAETDQIFLNSVAGSLTQNQLNNFQTAYSWGNHAGLYPSLTGSYANPSWISALSYSKLTGAPDLSVYLTQSIGDTRYALAGQSGFVLQPPTATNIGGVKAGTGVTIDANGVINVAASGTGTSSAWGNIPGNLTDQVDLSSALNSKVDKQPGRGLTTNDYDNIQKANVAAALAHASNTANPHNVTIAQLGFDKINNTSDAEKNAAATTLTNKTLISPVIQSPSGLVKADIPGINNVDNTSDINKPVSTAQAAAIAVKLTANPAITPGSGMKITYDAKGLVTGSSTATTADIAPSTNRNYVPDSTLAALQSGNIGGGIKDTSALLRKGNNLADLTNPSGARGNLGLGALATLNSVSNAQLSTGIDAAKITLNTLPVAQTPAYNGAITKPAGSDVTTLSSGIDALKIYNGAVSNAEFSYLDGTQSPIQAQFNGKQAVVSATGVLKGNGSGSVSTAVDGTDYMSYAKTKKVLDSFPELTINTGATGQALLFRNKDTTQLTFRNFRNGTGYTVVPDDSTGFHLNISGSGGTAALPDSATFQTSTDNAALAVSSTGNSAAPVLRITGQATTNTGNGKAFSIYSGSETFARSVFHSDGSYEWRTPNSSTGDLWLTRKGSGQLLVSSGKSAATAADLFAGRVFVTPPAAAEINDSIAATAGWVRDRIAENVAAGGTTAVTLTDGDKGDIDVVNGQVIIDSAVVNGTNLKSNTVINSKLATMAGLTVKGNAGTGTATPSDLTTTQLASMLSLQNKANIGVMNDLNIFTPSGIYAKNDGVIPAGTTTGVGMALNMNYNSSTQAQILADVATNGRLWWRPNVTLPYEQIWTSYNHRSDAQNDALYNPKLNFTPVQQGGGTGQLTNKINIGWDGNYLKGQVDNVDLGAFAFRAQLGSVAFSNNYNDLTNKPSSFIEGSFTATVGSANTVGTGASATLTGNTQKGTLKITFGTGSPTSGGTAITLTPSVSLPANWIVNVTNTSIVPLGNGSNFIRWHLLQNGQTFSIVFDDALGSFAADSFSFNYIISK